MWFKAAGLGGAGGTQGVMDMPSETFINKLKAQVNNPRVSFQCCGVTGDAYILDPTQISRNRDITVGFANIRLSNANETWNIFADNEDNVREVAELGLYFAGDPETMPLFAGTVEKVNYHDADVTLYLRDKMAPMLQNTIETAERPFQVDYDNAMNPADLAWAVLTDYGDLSDLATTGNPDIDYLSWSNWKTNCSSKSYSLCARFTGHEVRSALSLIAELTNSMIWIAGDGRFHFAPPYGSSECDTFTKSNCHHIDLEVTIEDLCNDLYCFYELLENGTWKNFYRQYDNTSISKWGRREIIQRGTYVWHNDQYSAQSFVEDYLDLYDTPVQYLYIHSMMHGFLAEIGDEGVATEPLKNISADDIRIIEIRSINLRDGTVELKALRL